VPSVAVELDDNIALVALDRPPVNALDRGMVEELTQCFVEFGARRDVDVVVLTASGTRAFCAGVDLADSQQRYDPEARAAASPLDQLDPGMRMREMFRAVYECPLPVIGAINSAAIGAGFVLASLCDVLFAADTARFGLTEINVGVLGGAAFAQRAVGPYKARRLFFSGELASALEMQEAGMLEDVVPAAELLDVAMAFARTVAAKSPIALRLGKLAFQRVEHLPTLEAYRLEQDYTEKLRGYDDSAEAGAAFREKRAPAWCWR
jgi:enoyl-CoA hydratase